MFKDYSDKFQNKKGAKTYFNILNDYQLQLERLDEAIVWEEVEEENPQQSLLEEIKEEPSEQETEQIVEVEEGQNLEEKILSQPDDISDDSATLEDNLEEEFAAPKECNWYKHNLDTRKIQKKTYDDEQSHNQFTLVTIGECGQGKSTSLSKISKLYQKNFAKDKAACHFEHKQSYKSVTGVCKTATTGDMILIDTPGFNDTNTDRSDKKILNELTKIIRPRLCDKKQGITAFIQCIMPDNSKRIRNSSIGAMNNVMFLLNSIDPRADPKKHPRLIVIFNDQSKYEQFESAKDIMRQAVAQAFQKKKIRKRLGYQEQID